MSSNGICFDIGTTVRAALQEFKSTRSPYCGSTDPHSAGNGSLMRLAPVPLFYSLVPETAMKLSADSSKTTHAAAAAVDACRCMAALIIGALQGRTKDEILSERFSPVDGYWEREPLCKEIDLIASGSFKRKSPPEIKGTGYVVESLEAALWAFVKGGTFKESCLLAANLGNDADTTAAICGQLAGAFHGEGGIPEHWRNTIAKSGLILGLADRLYDASLRAPSPEGGRTALPFSRSYWVVPGKLLAGQYPGSLDRNEELQRLSALLDLGVGFFIDLVEEDVAGSYEAPLSALSRQKKKSAIHIRHPIPDFSITTKGNMAAILDDMDAAIDKGTIVYLHCLGGRGRTGTVVGCWLMRHGLASGSDVISVIKRLRKGTPDAAMASPETSEQRRMVEGWMRGELRETD